MAASIEKTGSTQWLVGSTRCTELKFFSKYDWSQNGTTTKQRLDGYTLVT